MKNLKELSAKFENKGAQFIGIPMYETGKGRVYENLVINANIDSKNLAKSNLAKILAFDLSTFDFKGEPKELETLQTAYEEVLQSAKNALLPTEKKNARAKGQIDAYFHVNNAIKIHKDTLSVKIMGIKIKGTVIKEGEPYDLGKAQKTRYKRMIEFQSGYQVKKPYTLEKVASVKLQGDTLVLNG